MRMVHYYLALVLPAPFLLLATLLAGLFHDGSERHVGLGLVTAILCVGVHTLLILFMIVTGRVLRAAMQSRRLPGEFLEELNEFFARKKAYPVALGAAAATAATAVLGYGRNIGVPVEVHMLCGIGIVCLNPWAMLVGVRTLRENQVLIDRAADVLDRLDAATPEEERVVDTGPDWAFGPRARCLVFAVSAWLPYLYWALVVWRGEFARVAPAFLILTALASASAFLAAARVRKG
jgi:hypothetical protein